MSKDDIFKSSLREECGIAAVWDSNSYKTENPERLPFRPDDAARSGDKKLPEWQFQTENISESSKNRVLFPTFLPNTIYRTFKVMLP